MNIRVSAVVTAVAIAFFAFSLTGCPASASAPAVSVPCGQEPEASPDSAVGGLRWVSVSGASQQAESDTGYIALGDAPVVITLPASPEIGAIVAVTGAGQGGWRLAQNGGQVARASGMMGPGAGWRSALDFGSYYFVSMSANGRIAVAGALGGRLFVSADGARSWTAREASRSWVDAAASEDGSRIVALANSGQIYVSDDSGTTWAPREAARSWLSVCSSSDGRKMAALGINTQIYCSDDYGATWTARESSRNWFSIASSGDGEKLIAAVNGGQLYRSSDSGQTWTSCAPSRGWTAVASSSDGTKLFATAANDSIYVSADSGQSWLPRSFANTWFSVCCSGDGTKAMVFPTAGNGYISSNSGANWRALPVTVAGPPQGACMSANGVHAAFSTVGATGEVLVSEGSWESTTPGSGGFVSGKRYESAYLQYVGGGEYAVIQAQGKILLE